jgi:hypothetical protein
LSHSNDNGAFTQKNAPCQKAFAPGRSVWFQPARKPAGQPVNILCGPPAARFLALFFHFYQSNPDGSVRFIETAPHERLTVAHAFTHFIRSLFVNKWLNTFLL